MNKVLVAGLAAAALIAAAAVQAQPYGPGMMGGYGPGWGMMYGNDGYGPGCGPGCGYGPGMMRGYGPGPGMMRGWGPGYYAQGDLKLSADDVKKYLDNMIRNPNLKVGEVKEKDADTITADVVTKDKDVLVQRFDFNRHTGFYRTEQ